MVERRLDPSALARLIAGIFGRDGCDGDEAGCVAEHLVEASLRGHDSHGVIRTLRYHQWLEAGVIGPNRELLTLADAGPILLLDGQMGMGQRLARDAAAMGIARARAHGIALVALRRAGHVGRLGAYAEQACAAGLVSVQMANVAGSALVAPFGGAERRMSTAPVAIGVPEPEGGDFVLDFATSMVAEGKALVAARGGPPLPEGALVDGEGRRGADPAALYGDTLGDAVPDPRAGAGALRAMGEHKGSGLALACELLGGALTGNGANGPEGGGGPSGVPFAGNGLLMILIDPARLGDAAGIGAEVAAYLGHVRGARPEAGVGRVMVPGDPERARRAERLERGLSVPGPVAEGILGLAARLGIDAAGVER